MGVLIFFVMLVVLIVGHEFGHLLAAKRVGMEVPEFGVGFPPKLWSITLGTTEYSINALPFGGFVRIIGENGDAEHPNAFTQKSKLAQFFVLAAGPGMNIVLALFAFWIAFLIGVPTTIDVADRDTAHNPRVVVSQLLPDAPAAQAGVMVGDTLTRITHGAEVVEIHSPTDLSDQIAKHSEPLTLTVVRAGVETNLELTPVVGIIKDEPTKSAVGIGSVLIADSAYGFFGSLIEALKATWFGLVGVVMGFATLIASLFTFSASLENLSGPVGIASLAGDAALFGIGQVLSFAAIISLNLAVLNLLPFPALDGGRIALVGIEAIRGKAVKTSTSQMVNTVGFVLLILLMLVVTWHDIARLVA